MYLRLRISAIASQPVPAIPFGRIDYVCRELGSLNVEMAILLSAKTSGSEISVNIDGVQRHGNGSQLRIQQSATASVSVSPTDNDGRPNAVTVQAKAKCGPQPAERAPPVRLDPTGGHAAK